MPTLEEVVEDIRNGKFDLKEGEQTELEALTQADPEELSEVARTLVNNAEDLSNLLKETYDFENDPGVQKTLLGYTWGGNPEDDKIDHNPFRKVALIYDLISNYEGESFGPGKNLRLGEDFSEVQEPEPLFNHLLFDVENFLSEKEDYPENPNDVIHGGQQYQDIEPESHLNALKTRMDRITDYLEEEYNIDSEPTTKVPGVEKAVKKVRETVQEVLNSSNIGKTDLDAYMHDTDYDVGSSRLTLTYRPASTQPVKDITEVDTEKIESEIESVSEEFDDAENFRRWVKNLATDSELLPLQNTLPRNDYPLGALGRLHKYVDEYAEPVSEESDLVKMELEGEPLEEFGSQPSVGIGDLIHGGYIGSTHFIEGERGQKNDFEGDTIILDPDMVSEAFDKYVDMREDASKPIWYSDNFERSDYKDNKTSSTGKRRKPRSSDVSIHVKADTANFRF